jgi:hypothetical protein
MYVDIQGCKFRIPQDWKELTESQLLDIIPFVNEDSAECRLNILQNLVPSEALPFVLALHNQHEDLFHLTELLGWMYKTPLCTPVIPVFTLENGMELYLPKDSLENINVIEFVYADSYYTNIAKGISYDIDKLILSLCRPKRPDYDPENPNDTSDDPREKFNPTLALARLPLIEDFDYRKKLYFIKFFSDCKEKIAEMPRLQPLFQGGSKLNIPDYGWSGMLMELSKQGVFGNFEQTQYSNLMNALIYSAREAAISQAIEAEQK